MSGAPESDRTNQLDPSILAWVEAAIGGTLLGYLMGCESASLPLLISGETALSEKQRTIVTTFMALQQNIPPQLDDLSAKEMIRNFVTQITDEGESVARSIREHLVGSEAVPKGKNAMERALVSMAADSYPACLMSPDPALPPEIHDLGPHLAALLFRHPQSTAFSEAVLKDRVFKAIFSEDDERLERIATVYRNTGSGGDLQLVMLAQMLLQAAWRKRSSDSANLKSFAAAAIKELRLVRDVISGKLRTVTALFGFTGILLPPGRELQLSDGRVRATTEIDRRLVPESLKGQINTTDPSGTVITVNYDGDVVLEYESPYEVRAQPGRSELTPVWPVEMRPPLAMEQTVLRLRFSLMLAMERDYRVQLVQTWRAFDEPLSPGMVRSWSDPRQGAGFMPTLLTDTEVDAWGQWYDRLNTPDVARIELALSRILRAVAERREPSDVLIDAVIAWERLFGSDKGEPTFRVSMSLARLLEDTPEERLRLRTKLAKIYSLRSKVVHGSGTLKDNEYPLCQEALDIAIQAIRVLVTDHEDILRLPDGARRSATLLLGR